MRNKNCYSLKKKRFNIKIFKEFEMKDDNFLTFHYFSNEKREILSNKKKIIEIKLNLKIIFFYCSMNENMTNTFSKIETRKAK